MWGPKADPRREKERLVIELRGRSYPMNPPVEEPVPASLASLPKTIYRLLSISHVNIGETGSLAEGSDLASLSQIRQKTFERLAELEKEISVFAATLCRLTFIVRGGDPRAAKAVASDFYEEQLAHLPPINPVRLDVIRLGSSQEYTIEEIQQNISEQAKKAIDHLVNNMLTLIYSLVGRQVSEITNFDAGKCLHRLHSTFVLDWKARSPSPDPRGGTPLGVAEDVATEEQSAILGIIQAKPSLLPASGLPLPLEVVSQTAEELILSIPDWLTKYVRLTPGIMSEQIVNRQGREVSAFSHLTCTVLTLGNWILLCWKADDVVREVSQPKHESTDSRPTKESRIPPQRIPSRSLVLYVLTKPAVTIPASGLFSLVALQLSYPLLSALPQLPGLRSQDSFLLTIALVFILSFLISQIVWIATKLRRIAGFICGLARLISRALVTGVFLYIIAVMGESLGISLYHVIPLFPLEVAHFERFDFNWIFTVLFFALLGFAEPLARTIANWFASQGNTPTGKLASKAVTGLAWCSFCLVAYLSSLKLWTATSLTVVILFSSNGTRVNPDDPLPGLITPRKPPSLQEVPTVANAGPVRVDTAPPAAQQWSDLTGRFIYRGREPKKVLLARAGQQACNERDVERDEFEVFRTGDSGTFVLTEVIVHLVKPSAIHPSLLSAANKAATPPPNPIESCQFARRVMTLQVGNKLEIENRDSVPHLLTTTFRNNNFSCRLNPGEKAFFEPTTAEPEPGTIRCSLFPWIETHIMIVDHPYSYTWPKSASTMYDGTDYIDLAKVPRGWQKIAVWHPLTGYLTGPEGVDFLVQESDSYGQGVRPIIPRQSIGTIDLTSKIDAKRR